MTHKLDSWVRWCIIQNVEIGSINRANLIFCSLWFHTNTLRCSMQWLSDNFQKIFTSKACFHFHSKNHLQSPARFMILIWILDTLAWEMICSKYSWKNHCSFGLLIVDFTCKLTWLDVAQNWPHLLFYLICLLQKMGK